MVHAAHEAHILFAIVHVAAARNSGQRVGKVAGERQGEVQRRKGMMVRAKAVGLAKGRGKAKGKRTMGSSTTSMIKDITSITLKSKKGGQPTISTINSTAGTSTSTSYTTSGTT